MKDQKLFAFLAEVVMSMPASNMTSQSLSTIVSSYTKLGLFDERLFEHLATSAMSLPSSSFSLKVAARVDRSYPHSQHTRTC
eukprot:750757-Hanusia_phi.AAC.4